MTANLATSLRSSIPRAVLCLTLAVFAGACGNGSGAAAASGEKDTTAVKRFSSEVAAFLDPTSPRFDYAEYLPTTPVTPRSRARIAVITSSLASAQAVQFADAVKDAAGRIGWTAEALDGKYSVAVFELPPGGAASVSINAYQDALAAAVGACGGCSVVKETVPIADATAPGTPRYVVFLKNHRRGTLDYVAAGFDSGMIAYARSDQQFGRAETRTVGGLAASQAGVAEIIKQIGPVVVPSVPLGFVATATIDAIARRNAGQTVDHILLPAPLITAADAAKVPQGVFTPTTDYSAAFAALWK